MAITLAFTNWQDMQSSERNQVDIFGTQRVCLRLNCVCCPYLTRRVHRQLLGWAVGCSPNQKLEITRNKARNTCIFYTIFPLVEQKNKEVFFSFSVGGQDICLGGFSQPHTLTHSYHWTWLKISKKACTDLTFLLSSLFTVTFFECFHSIVSIYSKKYILTCRFIVNCVLWLNYLCFLFFLNTYIYFFIILYVFA